MISLASPRSILGRSFGVHRMLDGIGALLGPLVAFAILAALPNSYRTVFIVSFAFALVGFAILALFVDRRVAEPNRLQRFRAAIADELVHRPHLRRITLVAMMLGALTISDAFVFLSVRRVSEIRLEFFPLLFTGTAVVYLICAVPVGRIADRIGPRRVFFFGYMTLTLVYASLLWPLPGIFGPLAVVGGLGLFYASTDGVLMALASRFLGIDARATGLAIVATGAAFGRFVASILFGALWSAVGPDDAIALFMIALPVVLVVAWILTARGVGPTGPEADAAEALDVTGATSEP